MTYELLLQGNKKIAINEAERETLIQADENYKKNKLDAWVNLGKDRFKLSMVKGIFSIKGEQVSNWQEKKQIDEALWHNECIKGSLLSAEEKTKKELEARIFPGWRMAKLPEDHPILSDIFVKILEFFDKNPTYPRCPMKVWWPFIADLIAPEKKIKIGQTIISKRPNPNVFLGKWWKIIANNDESIERWVNYQQ